MLKLKCCHIDQIFVTGCSHWQKCCQNDNLSISGYTCIVEVAHHGCQWCIFVYTAELSWCVEMLIANVWPGTHMISMHCFPLANGCIPFMGYTPDGYTFTMKIKVDTLGLPCSSLCLSVYPYVWLSICYFLGGVPMITPIIFIKFEQYLVFISSGWKYLWERISASSVIKYAHNYCPSDLHIFRYFPTLF